MNSEQNLIQISGATSSGPSDDTRKVNGDHGRKFWRSLQELTETERFRDLLEEEFPSGYTELLDGLGRRRFMELMGASLALAGLVGCTKQPAEEIVPYVRQPEILVPGNPLNFSTAMPLGGFGTGLVVESDEGHPVKIEGNPRHPSSLGATSALHQASLLDLYDPDRTESVTRSGEISDWNSFLSVLRTFLNRQGPKGGSGLRILTETVTSPTLGAQIEALLSKYPNARWHQYDPVSRDSVREGSRMAFGRFVETDYRFDQADVVVSLESDFLFTHPKCLRYARNLTDRRRARADIRNMSRLYAAESTPTITGSMADHRLPVASNRVAVLARRLARELGLAVEPESTAASMTEDQSRWLNTVIDELTNHRGSSVVVAGESQPPEIHALMHAVNATLGNTGKTVFYHASPEIRPENQLNSLRDLVADMESGNVEMLVILEGNPVFSAPADLDFAGKLSKVDLAVHFSLNRDETSQFCHWHIPSHHFLESWSDVAAFDGTVSIIQPLIEPLYESRSIHELMDALNGNQGRKPYDIVRSTWKNLRPGPDFDKKWRRFLHDGVVPDTALADEHLTPATPHGAGAQGPPDQVLELVFRPDPTIWDGRFANNGWLQELAKPVSKLTWDNAALISPELAGEQDLENGEVVELVVEGRSLAVPVWIQPGQAKDSVALYLGYGRTRVGRIGRNTGFDAYQLRTTQHLWSAVGLEIRKTGRHYPVVSTQDHHHIHGEERQTYLDGTLREYLENPDFVQGVTHTPPPGFTLYNPKEHEHGGYQWGMSIDLNACIGCNACVLACQSENNIPVVGKEQVANGREMQWIRIDSYYQGEPKAPAILHQPVPCMQCENAPCELVCPVDATLHDKEGLNLQVYNRCIGTRYCSNNCPYKVRRFNFLQYTDYWTANLRPMRNPEVTVRWRGVMEKCTYCIQRISAARIHAQEQDRQIQEGEVQTACQQACPTEAIVFGNIADPDSHVSRLKQHPLNYAMLGELSTRPRTSYLVKLKNPNESLEPEKS